MSTPIFGLNYFVQRKRVPEYHQKYIQRLGAKLRVTRLTDWHGISCKSFIAKGGHFLHRKYGSVGAAVRAVFPKYAWKFTKRPVRRRGHWYDRMNKRVFLKNTEVRLSILDPYAWYRVSRAQITALGGGGILANWPQALKALHPTFDWNKRVFAGSNKRSGQRWLLYCIKELFSREEVIEEYCPGFQHGSSLSWITVDVFVPSCNLAFEYQGEQHYLDFPGAFGKALLCEKRDTEKLQLCREHGITVISIPYWWRGDLESIAATISFVRPDIRFAKVKGGIPLNVISRRQPTGLMTPAPFEL